MQDILTLALAAAFLATVGSFAVMGASQLRRTNALARKAHEMGMRFSAEDPFDVPRRYADFALVGGGHSPHAENVIYGRADGCPVRAFDFRYEVGHGTRRSTRRYRVVVMEAEPPAPSLLMWNDRDLEPAPLQARMGGQRWGCWTYRGPDDLAAALGGACEGDLAAAGASMQVRGTVFMLCLPLPRRRRDGPECLAPARGMLAALKAWVQEHPATPRDAAPPLPGRF